MKSLPPLLDDELFTRVIDQAFTLEEFKQKLASGKQLLIKYGVDVTAPFLHIGHAVNLWMMRMMQERGHKVQFMIGDFTTRIGDPTGKSQTRPVISKEEIEENAQKFIEQVSALLFTDPKVFEVRRNSEWLDPMPTSEFLQLAALVTHGRLIQRDMFQKRISEGSEIFTHELLYPLLQGYDSVALKSDLTIVGSDQLFNEMMGRFYQERFGQKPQVVLTTKITMGLDGVNKQSKSLNNYVALADEPTEKFGKLMSLPDAFIGDYLIVYTELPNAEIEQLKKKLPTDPMGVKKAMARAIVARYHGEEEATKAEEAFTNVFSKKGTPDDIQEVQAKPGETLIDLLARTKIVASKGEARRLIEQKGIHADDTPVTDITAPATPGIVKVGKRRFVKIV